MVDSRWFCVGVPGLEPGKTGPESVVLPITPYPKLSFANEMPSRFGCKSTTFFNSDKYPHQYFFTKSRRYSSFFTKSPQFYPYNPKLLTNFAPRKSDSSAVGSALRSGRRGRAFESPLSDTKSRGCVTIYRLTHPRSHFIISKHCSPVNISAPSEKKIISVFY